MGWWDYAPKLQATKNLEISNGSINAIWYLLHLPLLAYVVIIVAVQKEHTVVIDNSPFLVFTVDVLNNQPYLDLAQDPSPDIAQYCASAGGPYSCKNSTVEVYQECATWRVLFFFHKSVWVFVCVLCHIGVVFSNLTATFLVWSCSSV